MTDQKQYRILTPDGRLSHDTFVVASEQPATIQEGYVLVVNDRDGEQLTIHRDRLFLTANVGEPKKACPTCGHVLGVVEDQVLCPYDDRESGELVEPDSLSLTEVCAERSP